MVIEKLDVTYGQTFEEVEVDGEKKQKAVEGTGKTEHAHVKRLKWRRRTAIFGALKADGKNPSGKFVDAPIEVQEQFVIDLLTETLCDASGKNIVTADDLDDLDVWTDERRNAYTNAVVLYLSPKQADLAKNSSSTANDATS